MAVCRLVWEAMKACTSMWCMDVRRLVCMCVWCLVGNLCGWLSQGLETCIDLKEFFYLFIYLFIFVCVSTSSASMCVCV